MAKSNPLAPPVNLLIKLGSIAVHAEEFWSDDGHPYDKQVAQQLLADPEVKEWMRLMGGLAMIPVKRKP